jgi:hypothetical protein
MKITVDRAVLEQVLRSLESIDAAMPFPVAKLTIKNLRQVLGAEQSCIVHRAKEAFEAAKQRTWMGLTDDEIKAIDTDDYWYDHSSHEFARLIEAALKEKNNG